MIFNTNAPVDLNHHTYHHRQRCFERRPVMKIAMLMRNVIDVFDDASCDVSCETLSFFLSS